MPSEGLNRGAICDVLMSDVTGCKLFTMLLRPWIGVWDVTGVAAGQGKIRELELAALTALDSGGVTCTLVAQSGVLCRELALGAVNTGLVCGALEMLPEFDWLIVSRIRGKLVPRVISCVLVVFVLVVDC